MQLREAAQTSGGSVPLTSSLTILPQTLSSQTLLVWKVSYTTAELALAGQLESIACSSYEFTINSTEVVIQRRPDIVAIMRSGATFTVPITSLYSDPHSLVSLQISVSVDKCSYQVIMKGNRSVLQLTFKSCAMELLQVHVTANPSNSVR